MTEPAAPSASGTTSDALGRSRALTRRVLVSGGLVVVAAAAWALYVPGYDLPERPRLGIASNAVEAPLAPLEVAAFQTPVWTIAAPVNEPVAQATPPPPPPLKVQLIGTLKEGDTYKAVLYDPETNKVAVVSAGADVQGRKVERVAADSVSIASRGSTQVLSLKNQGASP